MGEAVSVPLLRLSARRASHPLVQQMVGRIAKDEAAHGHFGFIYLDWVRDQLSGEELRYLATAADNEIEKLERNWRLVAAQPSADGDTVGWLPRKEYLAAAYSALAHKVIGPLAERDIVVKPRPQPSSNRSPE